MLLSSNKISDETKDTPIEHFIDLRPMLKQDERLRKYVTIEGISEDSYLRSGELELNRRRNLMIKDGSIAEKYKP